MKGDSRWWQRLPTRRRRAALRAFARAGLRHGVRAGESLDVAAWYATDDLEARTKLLDVIGTAADPWVQHMSPSVRAAYLHGIVDEELGAGGYERVDPHDD